MLSKEFDLFYFLCSHQGQVLCKEQLYENVWRYNYVYDSKHATGFIRKRRLKVEHDPDNPHCIVTVWVLVTSFKKKNRKFYVIHYKAIIIDLCKNISNKHQALYPCAHRRCTKGYPIRTFHYRISVLTSGVSVHL